MVQKGSPEVRRGFDLSLSLSLSLSVFVFLSRSLSLSHTPPFARVRRCLCVYV